MSGSRAQEATDRRPASSPLASMPERAWSRWSTPTPPPLSDETHGRAFASDSPGAFLTP